MSAGFPPATPRHATLMTSLPQLVVSQPMLSRPRPLHLHKFRQDGQNIVWHTRSSDDRRLMLLQFPAVWLAGGCPQGFSFLLEEIRGDLRPTNVTRRQTHTRTRIHTHSCGFSEQFLLCVTAMQGLRCWTARGKPERASCKSGFSKGKR